MLSIGHFARHGRVSVRMLRHYDAIGLLRPAYVDEVTGYRSYDAEQLSRLNRIVALKDLGFTLQQVQSILDDRVSVEELRGMLRLRQAELQSRIATDTTRLAQVESRLQIIEREGAIPADADPGEDHDFAIVDLPEIEQAATIVHRGAMENVMRTIQTLARWIDVNGYRSVGYNRELYIEIGPDRDAWVTELKEPIVKGRT